MANENSWAKSLKRLITKLDVDDLNIYFDEELALTYQNEIWYLNGELYDSNHSVNRRHIPHSSSATKLPITDFVEAIHETVAASYFDEDIAEWHQNEIWYRGGRRQDEVPSEKKFSNFVDFVDLKKEEKYLKNIYGDQNAKEPNLPKFSEISHSERQIALTDYESSSANSPIHSDHILERIPNRIERHAQEIDGTDSVGVGSNSIGSPRLDSGYGSRQTTTTGLEMTSPSRGLDSVLSSGRKQLVATQDSGSQPKKLSSYGKGDKVGETSDKISKGLSSKISSKGKQPLERKSSPTKSTKDLTTKPKTSPIKKVESSPQIVPKKSTSSDLKVKQSPISKKSSPEKRKLGTSPIEEKSSAKRPLDAKDLIEKSIHKPSPKKSGSKEKKDLSKVEKSKTKHGCRAGPLTICKNCPCDKNYVNTTKLDSCAANVICPTESCLSIKIAEVEKKTKREIGDEMKKAPIKYPEITVPEPIKSTELAKKPVEKTISTTKTIKPAELTPQTTPVASGLKDSKQATDKPKDQFLQPTSGVSAQDTIKITESRPQLKKEKSKLSTESAKRSFHGPIVDAPKESPLGAKRPIKKGSITRKTSKTIKPAELTPKTTPEARGLKGSKQATDKPKDQFLQPTSGVSAQETIKITESRPQLKKEKSKLSTEPAKRSFHGPIVDAPKESPLGAKRPINKGSITRKTSKTIKPAELTPKTTPVARGVKGSKQATDKPKDQFLQPTSGVSAQDTIKITESRPQLKKEKSKLSTESAKRSFHGPIVDAPKESPLGAKRPIKKGSITRTTEKVVNQDKVATKTGIQPADKIDADKKTGILSRSSTTKGTSPESLKSLSSFQIPSKASEKTASTGMEIIERRDATSYFDESESEFYQNELWYDKGKKEKGQSEKGSTSLKKDRESTGTSKISIELLKPHVNPIAIPELQEESTKESHPKIRRSIPGLLPGDIMEDLRLSIEVHPKEVHPSITHELSSKPRDSSSVVHPSLKDKEGPTISVQVVKKPTVIPSLLSDYKEAGPSVPLETTSKLKPSTEVVFKESPEKYRSIPELLPGDLIEDITLEITEGSADPLPGKDSLSTLPKDLHGKEKVRQSKVSIEVRTKETHQIVKMRRSIPGLMPGDHIEGVRLSIEVVSPKSESLRKSLTGEENIPESNIGIAVLTKEPHKTGRTVRTIPGLMPGDHIEGLRLNIEVSSPETQSERVQGEEIFPETKLPKVKRQDISPEDHLMKQSKIDTKKGYSSTSPTSGPSVVGSPNISVTSGHSVILSNKKSPEVHFKDKSRRGPLSILGIGPGDGEDAKTSQASPRVAEKPKSVSDPKADFRKDKTSHFRIFGRDKSKEKKTHSPKYDDIQSPEISTRASGITPKGTTLTTIDLKAEPSKNVGSAGDPRAATSSNVAIKTSTKPSTKITAKGSLKEPQRIKEPTSKLDTESPMFSAKSGSSSDSENPTGVAERSSNEEIFIGSVDLNKVSSGSRVSEATTKIAENEKTATCFGLFGKSDKPIPREKASTLSETALYKKKSQKLAEQAEFKDLPPHEIDRRSSVPQASKLGKTKSTQTLGVSIGTMTETPLDSALLSSKLLVLSEKVSPSKTADLSKEMSTKKSQEDKILPQKSIAESTVLSKTSTKKLDAGSKKVLSKKSPTSVDSKTLKDKGSRDSKIKPKVSSPTSGDNRTKTPVSSTPESKVTIFVSPSEKVEISDNPSKFEVFSTKGKKCASKKSKKPDKISSTVVKKDLHPTVGSEAEKYSNLEQGDTKDLSKISSTMSGPSVVEEVGRIMPKSSNISARSATGLVEDKRFSKESKSPNEGQESVKRQLEEAELEGKVNFQLNAYPSGLSILEDPKRKIPKAKLKRSSTTGKSAVVSDTNLPIEKKTSRGEIFRIVEQGQLLPFRKSEEHVTKIGDVAKRDSVSSKYSDTSGKSAVVPAKQIPTKKRGIFGNKKDSKVPVAEIPHTNTILHKDIHFPNQILSSEDIPKQYHDTKKAYRHARDLEYPQKEIIEPGDSRKTTERLQSATSGTSVVTDIKYPPKNKLDSKIPGSPKSGKDVKLITPGDTNESVSEDRRKSKESSIVESILGFFFNRPTKKDATKSPTTVEDDILDKEVFEPKFVSETYPKRTDRGKLTTTPSGTIVFAKSSKSENDTVEIYTPKLIIETKDISLEKIDVEEDSASIRGKKRGKIPAKLPQDFDQIKERADSEDSASGRGKKQGIFASKIPKKKIKDIQGGASDSVGTPVKKAGKFAPKSSKGKIGSTPGGSEAVEIYVPNMIVETKDLSSHQIEVEEDSASTGSKKPATFAPKLSKGRKIKPDEAVQGLTLDQIKEGFDSKNSASGRSKKRDIVAPKLSKGEKIIADEAVKGPTLDQIKEGSDSKDSVSGRSKKRGIVTPKLPKQKVKGTVGDKDTVTCCGIKRKKSPKEKIRSNLEKSKLNADRRTPKDTEIKLPTGDLDHTAAQKFQEPDPSKGSTSSEEAVEILQNIKDQNIKEKVKETSSSIAEDSKKKIEKIESPEDFTIKESLPKEKFSKAGQPSRKDRSRSAIPVLAEKKPPFLGGMFSRKTKSREEDLGDSGVDNVKKSGNRSHIDLPDSSTEPRSNFIADQRKDSLKPQGKTGAFKVPRPINKPAMPKSQKESAKDFKSSKKDNNYKEPEPIVVSDEGKEKVIFATAKMPLLGEQEEKQSIEPGNRKTNLGKASTSGARRVNYRDNPITDNKTYGKKVGPKGGLPRKDLRKTATVKSRSTRRGRLENVEIEEENPNRKIFSGYDRAFVYPRDNSFQKEMMDDEDLYDRKIRSGYDRAFARKRCHKLMFVREEFDSPRPLPTDRDGVGLGVGQGTAYNMYEPNRDYERSRYERRDRVNRYDRYDRLNGYDKYDRQRERALTKEDRRKGKCLGWII